jgi:hypothetical protein
MKSANGTAALDLAAAGHPVLPLHNPTGSGCSCGHPDCGRPGKHPRGVYGLTYATLNRSRIEAWWHGQPEANIGLRADGLVVFDLDGPAGERSLAELEQELGELPASRGQWSGRGQHRFYGTPPGVVSIGNSTHPLGDPPGLDLRAGRRGYVVAAPSLHASGEHYRWVDPEAPIAPLPESWLERLLELPSLPPAMRWPSRRLGPGESTRYGLVVLRRELAKIRSAPEGARNNTLNRSVFNLARLAAGGELELELVEQTATEAALNVGLDWLEVDLTIASAVAAGSLRPRSRKPRS